jgi:uncharacterized protein YndB with AHSA1/START domain
MAAWIGPAGYTGADVRMDPRPGGAYRMCIRGDDGTAEWWFGGVYREVVPPERLVFTFAWDPEGDEPPFETLVRVELEDLDGHTRMRFHQTPFVSDASRESHRDGWEQCFADLGAHLSGA